jgi:hypothetical protein
MAALPLVLTAASTAFSVIGAIQQGNAQAAQYEAEAQTRDYNATVAKNSELAANQQTAAREDAERRQRRIMLGTARASSAQSGLGDTGSILDLFDQTAITSELDILNSRYEGNLAAKGYGEQAVLERFGAANARSNASTAKRASWLNAGSALLSGASNGYMGYKNQQYQDEQRKVWRKQGLA